MLHGLTAREFMEWQAYAQLEPFSEIRADYRAALIAQTVFNMAVTQKDRKPLSEFLLDWEGEKRESSRKQSVEEQIAIAKILAMACEVPHTDE